MASEGRLEVRGRKQEADQSLIEVELSDERARRANEARAKHLDEPLVFLVDIRVVTGVVLKSQIGKMIRSQER